MNFSAETMWGWLSLALAVIAYVPYFISIFGGKTRPHFFTWFVWALLTSIGFFAQEAGGAGPGAWATGISAVACGAIALLALKFGEKHITRSDWATFVAALLAIPLWMVTKNPLLAVLLITVIDILGYYPTFRKSWHKPGEELLFTYIFNALQFAASMAAMHVGSWTTILYPAAITVMSVSFVAMVVWRRQVLAQKP